MDGVELDVELVEAERGVWLLRSAGLQTVAVVDGTGTKTVVEIRRPGADPLVLAAEVTDARRAKIAVPARCARPSRGGWSSCW